jgi:hypothetical protein
MPEESPFEQTEHCVRDPHNLVQAQSRQRNEEAPSLFLLTEWRRYLQTDWKVLRRLIGRRLHPAESYRSMGRMVTDKTNRWDGWHEKQNTAASLLGALRRSIDSIVSAFVVGNPVSRKFILREQFQVDLMPIVFAQGRCARLPSPGRLVGENVAISHCEPDGLDDPRKIMQMVGGKNAAPGYFR